ncbi:methyltransferase domain-containing protein [Leptolyngbya sp. FACHB-261]|uniref:methyltransferase domain-containing protein n=1 Tax=Leptolyngbya sp. FACHB-261 TaxID=2692806 RepID=UPI001686967E|nr:methyltransferase domain-containing protein [Leptolyngbya sp. FACHB-261]MBD2102069.1 methyltransferase domain-containing protein [Leptolyngbya sp. FACHB-261]
MTASLNQRIRNFYDASSGLWEQVWGEHMHHGYYAPGEDSARKNRVTAQIDLVEELLRWAQLEQANQALDVGCGIGGSSRLLAQRYGAQVVGITLSPVQAQRATERSDSIGLTAQTQFQVADALAMPFADGQFDLVWSLESGEHMPDKKTFLQECYRVLKPGGKLMLATWCHRQLGPGFAPLSADEQQHLADIYRVYCLPYMISLAEYEQIAQGLGFTAIRTDDWSERVAPFWDLVIDSALDPRNLLRLLTSGWNTVEAALALPLMSRGYRRGLVKFGVLCASR